MRSPAEGRTEGRRDLGDVLDAGRRRSLLVDDGFTASTALQVNDVPNVALISAKGQLVVSKIKHRSQLLIGSEGNVEAEQIVRRVADGEEIPTIGNMFPFYPAQELFGSCAPSFTLKKFNTQESYTFSGKSPSGRPTLVMFWSSMCPHCQIEIPQLVAWLKTHPDTIDIVSVTNIKPDRPGSPSHRTVTAAYIKTQGIAWPVLEDPGHAVEDLYGIVSTRRLSSWRRTDTSWTRGTTRTRKGSGRSWRRSWRAPRSPAPCKPHEFASGPKMDFTVAGGDNKRVALGDIADKPSIVHFWATWCQPCIKELPSLVRLRDKMEKDGTGSVIFVSVEDDRAGAAIAKFQTQSKLDMRSYRAPRGGLADKVDLSYRVPRSYLVGPGGVILASRQGSQNWDDPKNIEWASARLAGAAAAARSGGASRAGGR
jgi:thiol-disulfide isomerase/thioredoxin